jgi:hypothetical protein
LHFSSVASPSSGCRGTSAKSVRLRDARGCFTFVEDFFGSVSAIQGTPGSEPKHRLWLLRIACPSRLLEVERVETRRVVPICEASRRGLLYKWQLPRRSGIHRPRPESLHLHLNRCLPDDHPRLDVNRDLVEVVFVIHTSLERGSPRFETQASGKISILFSLL